MKSSLAIAAALVFGIIGQSAFAKSLTGTYVVDGCNGDPTGGDVWNNVRNYPTGAIVHIEALDELLWVNKVMVDGSTQFLKHGTDLDYTTFSKVYRIQDFTMHSHFKTGYSSADKSNFSDEARSEITDELESGTFFQKTASGASVSFLSNVKAPVVCTLIAR